MPLPSPASRFASAADRAACREMIRNGSKSFAAAALLLPPRVREAAYALYAFCRLSDDLIDVDGGTMEAIGRLRDRLARAYQGRPAGNPVDRAFADVVAAYALPRALPEALIDGLAWDVDGVVCETLSDVYAYGARVAGTVGAMMAVLMETREPAMVARACDLGVAMQLTNIARDVGEDAANGRLYLPRAWMREAGLDPESWLADPQMNAAIASVIERLLEQAEALYRRADAGIAHLPVRCRPGIFAARRIYSAIGADIARHGFDSMTRRARVPGRAKLGMALYAVGDAARLGSLSPEGAPLPETAFLVDAVAAHRPAFAVAGPVSGRILWVAALFADLDMRQRVS